MEVGDSAPKVTSNHGQVVKITVVELTEKAHVGPPIREHKRSLNVPTTDLIANPLLLIGLGVVRKCVDSEIVQLEFGITFLANIKQNTDYLSVFLVGVAFLVDASPRQGPFGPDCHGSEVVGSQGHRLRFRLDQCIWELGIRYRC